MVSAQPNIVFILADDLGAGDIGALNDGLTETPAIDGFIRGGVFLSQHYSASSACAPARASLLTGKYPHRTGAVDDLEGRGLDRIAIGQTLLPEYLKNAGYETGLVGKWHNGALDWRYHPNARGLDEFVGFRGGWQDYYDWELDCNGLRMPKDGRYLTDVITDEAVSFVDRHRRAPFLLFVCYGAVHKPLQGLDDDVRRYEATGRFTPAVSILYGMVKAMDRGVGRILDALRKFKQEENTIVVFSSDNGPELGGADENCLDRFNLGLRGGKESVYEGGIRVPLAVRWPGRFQGGVRMDGMTHFCDWAPTFMTIAGVDIPDQAGMDGVNILPLLRGEPAAVPAKRFWQWNRYSPVGACNAAMRDGDWKLVRPPLEAAMKVSNTDMMIDWDLKYNRERMSNVVVGPEPDRTLPSPPEPELYNIREDPGEKNNLAAEQTKTVSRMTAELDEWFRKVEAERRALPGAGS